MKIPQLGYVEGDLSARVVTHRASKLYGPSALSECLTIVSHRD